MNKQWIWGERAFVSPYPALSVALTNDRRMYSLHENEALLCWNLSNETYEQCGSIPSWHLGMIEPGGAHVAVATSKEVRLYRTKDASLLRSFPTLSAAQDLWWQREGVLSFTEKSLTRLFVLQTGAVFDCIDGSQLWAITADGSLFVHANQWGTGPLWMRAAGEQKSKPVTGVEVSDVRVLHLGAERWLIAEAGGCVYSLDAQSKRVQWKSLPLGKLLSLDCASEKNSFAAIVEKRVDGARRPVLVVLDAESGSERYQKVGVESVALSMDGTRAVLGNGTPFRSMDVRTGRLLGEHSSRGIDAIAFSPSGRFLAAVHDGIVSIIDVASGERTHWCEGVAGSASCAAWFPDEVHVVVGADAELSLWQVREQSELGRWSLRANSTHITVAPEQNELLISVRSNHGEQLVLWSLEARSERWHTQERTESVRGKFVEEEVLLASQRGIHRYKRSDGSMLAPVHDLGMFRWQSIATKDSLLTAREGNVFVAYDWAGKRRIHAVLLEGEATRWLPSSDGSRAVFLERDRASFFLAHSGYRQTAAETLAAEANEAFACADFSPDGKLFAVGTKLGRILLFR